EGISGPRLVPTDGTKTARTRSPASPAVPIGPGRRPTVHTPPFRRAESRLRRRSPSEPDCDAADHLQRSVNDGPVLRCRRTPPSTGVRRASRRLSSTTPRPRRSQMTPTTMQAVRLDTARQYVQIETVPVPEPAADEVLVKIAYAGVCLSDLHFIDGQLAPGMPPIVTLGHEAAGVVAAVGPEVTTVVP